MNINRQEISRLAGFVGAALLIAGYVRHTIQELWGPFNLTLIIAGAALLLVSIVLNFGTILDFFRGRSGKLGTNTVALSVAVQDVMEGMTIPGIVTNLTNFGAFVDIGAKQDALLHISQITRKYISSPAEVLKLGQEVSVTVMQVDVSRKRINLTMLFNAENPKK